MKPGKCTWLLSIVLIAVLAAFPATAQEPADTGWSEAENPIVEVAR